MGNLIIEQLSFNKEHIKSIENDFIIDYPIVYLLNNQSEIYIGESVRFKSRMNEHLKIEQRKRLTQTTIIGCDEFNQSATFNLETNLINYILADGRFKLQNVSKVASKTMHNYHNKNYYNKKLFFEVWQELQKLGIVNNDIRTINDQDIFKISPFKELSQEQYDIRNAAIDFCERNIDSNKRGVFLIDGDAGTGKSVVLSSLYNLIQDLSKDKNSKLYNTNNYLLVNHTEMLKTYHNIAGVLPNLQTKNILKPTSLINYLDKQQKQADIVIVDEAHLLLTKKDSYNNFKQDNQLAEIINRSRITIIVFDQHQSLKIKGMWDFNLLKSIIKNCKKESVRLSEQFRVQANKHTIAWMDAFIQKDIMPIPEDKSFELLIFDDANKMYQ